MAKVDLINKLLESGKTEEELKDKTVAELEVMINDIKDKPESEKFKITDMVLKEGYENKIDDTIVVVIPAEFGESVNTENGMKVFGMKKSALSFVGGKPSGENVIDSVFLTPHMVYILVTASVLVLSNENQVKIFNEGMKK